MRKYLQMTKKSWKITQHAKRSKYIKKKILNQCMLLDWFVYLIDLSLYCPVNNLQLRRDGSSWVEPVLSKDSTQWHRWGSNLQPLCLKSSTLPLCLIDDLNLPSPVSQFILPPGQLAPRGASQPRLAYPPGGKLSRDILPPTLVIFTPGGQAVQAGLSCPPPNTSKNIYMLFCYFSLSF